MGVVLELPDSLRGSLKEPMGPVFTEAGALLTEAGEPIVAVGDMVTYHLLRAGVVPDVAVIDGKTERSAVDREVAKALRRATPGDGGRSFDERVEVDNPPATLSEALLSELRAAIDREERVAIVVDGEEDLAALPAIVLAPWGASVVYGQPGRGMVLVTVDEAAVERISALLDRMDGDHDRLWALLGDGD